jgi:hypothetical protein
LDRHHELLTNATRNRLEAALGDHAPMRSSVRNSTSPPARTANHSITRSIEITGTSQYWACLVLLVMSCRHSPDDNAQGTTAQIVHAVEMTRQVSNHDKRAWLDKLRALPCKSEDVCQLKDLCTNAYDSHLKGVDSIGQALAVVSSSTVSESTADASVGALLDVLSSARAAQGQLRSAKQQTQACAETEAVIRQRYRL